MPVTKSAQKKMRQDGKRRLRNLRVKRTFKEAVKAVRKDPTPKNLKKAYSALDKAAQKGVIKKGKAARLKSRLSKLVKKE